MKPRHTNKEFRVTLETRHMPRTTRGEGRLRFWKRTASCLKALFERGGGLVISHRKAYLYEEEGLQAHPIGKRKCANAQQSLPVRLFSKRDNTCIGLQPCRATYKEGIFLLAKLCCGFSASYMGSPRCLFRVYWFSNHFHVNHNICSDMALIHLSRSLHGLKWGLTAYNTRTEQCKTRGWWGSNRLWIFGF